MTRRVVGILGGMGPEATILLQQRLMGLVEATDDADHIPLLIDMNPQVPSRIKHLIDGTGETPAPVLAAMAQRLQAAGATALAMPCNTAHHYAVAIQDSVSIPLLNMVDVSVAAAAGRLTQGARVGILASPAVKRVGVFEARLERAGLSSMWPSDSDAMLHIIRSIKRNGPTDAARLALAQAAEQLGEQGAAMVFVACSEFSLIADAVPNSIPAIDTVDSLAAAIRDHTLNG